MPGPAMVGVLGFIGTYIARFMLIRFVLALGLFGLNNYIIQSFLNYVQLKFMNALLGAPQQFVAFLMGCGIVEAFGILVAAYLLVHQVNGLKYAVMGGNS